MAGEVEQNHTAAGQGNQTECACGHEWDAHEFVPGVRFQTNGFYWTEEDGTRIDGLPNVWVCSGGRETDSDDPWDHVCGCVLHSPPPRAEALGDSA